MSIIRDIINKKKEMIAKKKNATDAGQSKVVGTTEDGARIIENGDDKFIVSDVITNGSRSVGNDRDFDATRFDFECRIFTVKDGNGHCESLSIQIAEVTHKGDIPVDHNRVWFNPIFKDISKDLKHDCNDINNLNHIRYCLKDSPEASYFLDKFVIVTPEERQAYQEYAAPQDMKEKQAKEAQEQAARLAKIRARQERRDSRKQERIQKKEQKIQAKAKLAEEAEKKALEKKIEEKFFGRK